MSNRCRLSCCPFPSSGCCCCNLDPSVAGFVVFASRGLVPRSNTHHNSLLRPACASSHTHSHEGEAGSAASLCSSCCGIMCECSMISSGSGGRGGRKSEKSLAKKLQSRAFLYNFSLSLSLVQCDSSAFSPALSEKFLSPTSVEECTRRVLQLLLHSLSPT